MALTVVSYVLIVAVAWIGLLALVVLGGGRGARPRQQRDAAARATAWVERRGGEDRRVVFDRRSGLTDRRMGLPDDRDDCVERRSGPPERRSGGDRRAGPD